MKYHIWWIWDFLSKSIPLVRQLKIMGPRKEFFRLMLIQIKEKYFDCGSQPYLSKDYMKCGIVMGLRILQNGRIPQFLPEETLNELVYVQSPSPCILNLRRGLQKVGVYEVMANLPLFLHLFRPSPSSSMTVKNVVHLLVPRFGEQGTNARKHCHYFSLESLAMVRYQTWKTSLTPTLALSL